MLLLIAVITLASLSLYLYSELVHMRSGLSEARDELAMVSGIIVSSGSYFYEESGEVRFSGLLRLTSEDEVNGVKTGEIANYRLVFGSYVELEAGNLVTGSPIEGEPRTLNVRNITSFIRPPIINAGEYIKLDARLTTVGPYLSLGGHNLGEKDIISVRVEVNGTLIPFFFGVDKEHPVEPYGYLQDSVPTSWFDPASNRTVGFNPVHGEIYPMIVKLTLSEDPPLYLYKTVKTWNLSVTAKSLGSIASIGSSSAHIEIHSAYLFKRSTEGEFLSFEVRNVWNNTVTGMKILVDNVTVADVKTNLQVSHYWKACVKLPFDINVGSVHMVTIVTLTTDGESDEISQDVKCVRM